MSETPALSGPPVLNLQVTSDYEELLWGYDADEFGPGMAIYRPSVPSGTFILGDHAQATTHNPLGVTTVVGDDGGAGYLAAPTGFSFVPNARGEGAIWTPLAPSGYVALGCVATASGTVPQAIDNLRCVRRDLVRPVEPGPMISWQTTLSLYSVPGLGLFQGQPGVPMDVTDPATALHRLPASVDTWIPNSL